MWSVKFDDVSKQYRKGGPAYTTIGSELCWDSSFERTFFSSDDTRQCEGGVCPEGDAATCAFQALF